MIPKTMPQTGRRDEFQRRRHIAHYNLLDKKYQAIKKEHDEIADYVTQQLEAYRNKHGKEMRRVTDEYLVLRHWPARMQCQLFMVRFQLLL